jgi:uncharacterized RDD family membrane protein YckC
LSSRKPGYLFGLFLLAALCTSPHLLVLFMSATEAVQMRQWPFQFDPIWKRLFQRGETISYSTFFGDQFLYVSYRDRANDVFEWDLIGVDPRTRIEKTLNVTIRSGSGLQPLNFGSRLWFIGNGEEFELVDGAIKPSNMVNPTPYVDEQHRFLLDVEPAVIARSNSQFAISTFAQGVWSVSHHLLLPGGQGQTVIDGIPMQFANTTNATCLNQGERIHLFLEVDDRLLYREGLDLQAVAGTPIQTSGLSDEPVSALSAANASGTMADWTVINQAPIAGEKLGILVNGQPAALIVDRTDPGAIVGQLFRRNGEQWTAFATMTFPFGTAHFRAVTSQDAQSSFIMATTSTGVVHAYEVDASGVRPTPGNQEVATASDELTEIALGVGVTSLIISMLTAFLGLGTALLMWLYTRPDYDFGTQRVRLARIFGRGVARMVDLVLIGVSTIALAWWLTRHLDWLSLAEAVNLQLPHPAVQSAMRTIWTLILWLITCEALLVVGQARWGLTIGKWCCSLRTMQTTLRPCGLARSLVRELVFWFDVCCLLCWAPGIVSIALTDRRQRFGDLVADTLVVDVLAKTR